MTIAVLTTQRTSQPPTYTKRRAIIGLLKMEQTPQQQKFAPEHPYWKSVFNAFLSIFAVNGAHQEQPDDLSSSTFTDTDSRLPYFKSYKGANYVGDLIQQAKNTGVNLDAEYPGLAESIPSAASATDEILASLEQTGILWSPSLRADPSVHVYEIFGVPTHNVKAYLRQLVSRYNFTILKWYKSTRPFSTKLSVDLVDNDNTNTINYSTCILYIMVPVNQYMLIPEDELHLSTEFHETDTPGSNPFRSDIHPSIPVYTSLKALKNRKAKKQADYLTNIPPYLPASLVKSTIAHAIRTKYAQNLRSRNMTVGKVWDTEAQFEIFGTRKKNGGGMLYFIAAVTEAGLRMARKIVSDGLVVFGRNLLIAVEDAANAIDAKVFTEYKGQVANKKFALYTDGNVPEPAILHRFIEYNTCLGSIATLSTARVGRYSRKWGFSRTTFLTFTTSAMKDKFQRWAEAEMNSKNGLELGLATLVRVPMPKNAYADIGEDDDDYTATTQIVLEPEDELYISPDEVAPVTVADIGSMTLALNEDLTLSDLSDDDTDDTAAATPTTAGSAGAKSNAGKKKAGAKGRKKQERQKRAAPGDDAASKRVAITPPSPMRVGAAVMAAIIQAEAPMEDDS